MKRKPTKNRPPSRGPQSRAPQSRASQPRASQSRAPQSGRPQRSNHDPVAQFGKGVRVVVGLHAVAEALRVRPKAVTQLWLRTGWEDANQLRELHDTASAKKIRFEEKSPGVLDRIAASHQGVCALVTESPQWEDDMMAQPGPMTVMLLDGIEDPQNLGAILRTAWLMNVKAIFVPQDRSAQLTPAAMKVASGGAEHVPVVVVSSLSRTLEELKENQFWTYGLSEKGKQNIWQLKLSEKIAWVVGAEDKGLRSTTESACDELVHIPQVATGSSYNASVAAAIVLAEGARQGARP